MPADVIDEGIDDVGLHRPDLISP